MFLRFDIAMLLHVRKAALPGRVQNAMTNQDHKRTGIT